MGKELRQKDGEAGLNDMDAIKKIAALEGTPVDDQVIQVNPPVGKLWKKENAAKGEIVAPTQGVPRILIAVPTIGPNLRFYEDFLAFWMKLLLRKDRRLEVACKFIKAQSVAIAETEAVCLAKDNGCTHVLMIDDDIYDLKVEHLDMLLDADVDVISGVMYASGFPYAMCTFRRFNNTVTVSSQPVQKSLYRLYEVPCRCPVCMKDGLIVMFRDWADKVCPNCNTELKKFAVQPVDLIPFPFTLFKMSVFDKIKTPWFHCSKEFPTDSWFADRCIEAGIQEYAHMAVRLNHREITDISRPHRYNEGLAIRTAEGKSTQVVQILPEQMLIHEKLMEQRMNEAEMALRLNLDGGFHKTGDGDLWTAKVNEKKQEKVT